MYVAYISDLLAFAVDADSQTHHHQLTDGRRYRRSRGAAAVERRGAYDDKAAVPHDVHWPLLTRFDLPAPGSATGTGQGIGGAMGSRGFLGNRSWGIITTVTNAATSAISSRLGAATHASTAVALRAAAHQPSAPQSARTQTRSTDEALPAPLSSAVNDLRGVRCYGWAGRGVEKKSGNRGAWMRAVVSGVAFGPHGEYVVYDSASGARQGWAFTNVEVAWNGSAWLPLAKRSKKPGLTSVVPGDSFLVRVDTSLSEVVETRDVTTAAPGTPDAGTHPDEPRSDVASAAAAAPATSVPVLQLTYLESYEQVGIVRVECTSGCECKPTRVDTLRPRRRFATLSTALTGPVSRSAGCVVRITNVSPPPNADGSRTKVKLVSLAVLAQRQRRRNS